MNTSESSIDCSLMSGPASSCEICELGYEINHICADVAQLNFQRLKLQEEFQIFPENEIEDLVYEEVIEYNDEGEEDIEEADFSTIDDLEESIGYVTRTFETPPRRMPPQRRRSSTPDPTRSRNSSITFDEFIENLIDDSLDIPGLEAAAAEAPEVEAAAAEAPEVEAAAEAVEVEAADEADFSEWMEF